MPSLSGRRIWLVGIGGAGLSAYALLARGWGAEVGGWDRNETPYLGPVRDAGIEVRVSAEPAAPDGMLSPENLLERAQRTKVRISSERLFAAPQYRRFPLYLDSNRFLSNLPGTTILFPVVDLSHQYINGMMYLLTQPEGARPNAAKPGTNTARCAH